MVNILINRDGVIRYYNNNGEFHRLNGPCFISNTTKQWCLNGEVHRIDGPAVIYFDTKDYCIPLAWWYHGVRIDCKSQEEFERYIRLLIFK